MKNKTILIGNVGKDPEIRNLQGGNIVAKLNLATSESYKNKQGEKVTNTEWHRIEAWGKLAEMIEKYVKKGDLIYVEGKIKYGSYDNKDGVKMYTTDIVINELTMLGGNKKQDDYKQKPDIQPDEDMSEDQNLPF